MGLTGDGPAAKQRLEVILTGELVTIAGGSRFPLDVADRTDLRSVFGVLARDFHPWFAALLAPGGAEDPLLGTLMILLNGKQVRLPEGLDLPVGPGDTLYLIPPIPGG